ncbi:MAG: SHOCT domain-containing protein [Bacteroidia bacterium]|nr:SHOCT domain-containing protein [Bacteroidia bacterium]
MDALIAKLEKLNELKERGIITPEEFEEKKRSLLKQL